MPLILAQDARKGRTAVAAPVTAAGRPFQIAGWAGTLRRMRSLFLLLGLLAIAVMGACGNSSSRSDAAGLVPEDSAVYGEVVLNPEGDQQEAVEKIASRFPGGGDLDAQIAKGLSEALRESGLDYGKDVEPWIGDDAVFFVTDVREDGAEGALIVPTQDEDATRAAFEKLEGKPKKRTYEDVDYLLAADEAAYGVVDGNAVIGTEAGLKQAVDTAGGDQSIEDSDRANDALERLDDPLLSVYIDGRKLAGAFAGPDAAIAAPLLESFDSAFTVGITAEPDALVVDSTVPAAAALAAPYLVSGGGTEVVSELPADSFFAVGQAELGEALTGFFDLIERSGTAGGGAIDDQVKAATGLDLEQDILAWMGDLGGFARGTSPLEIDGGVVVLTKDPDSSRRTLDALGRLAREEAAGEGERVGPLDLPGGGDGFTVASDELPQPIHIVQRGERVVAAYGDEAAEELLEPSRPLSENQEFTDASERLGEGYEVSNYIAAEPIIELVDGVVGPDEEGYAEAKPYLEAFSRLITGSRKDGEDVVSRTRIELR